MRRLIFQKNREGLQYTPEAFPEGDGAVVTPVMSHRCAVTAQPVCRILAYATEWTTLSRRRNEVEHCCQTNAGKVLSRVGSVRHRKA